MLDPARVAVTPDHDLDALVAAAGAPSSGIPVEGGGRLVPHVESKDGVDLLVVPGVTQAALEAALAAYNPAAARKAGLVAYANARQWALATGGRLVTIGGQPIPFATDDVALGLMDGKVMRLAQANPPATVNWQIGPTAFATIAADDFVAAALAVSDFVQATFDALPAIFVGIAAGTVTTRAQVDAALAAVA